MQFNVVADNAGRGNTQNAQAREALKMSCIAWCLQDMGHDVRLSMNAALQSWDIAQFFESVKSVHGIRDAVHIYPARSLFKQGRPQHSTVVCVKDSKKQNEIEILESCDILIAHEYNHKEPYIQSDDPRMITVPWLCHDVVIRALYEEGLLLSYLRDDLQALRSALCPSERIARVAFAGANIADRRQIAEAFESHADIVWVTWVGDVHARHRSPLEYMKWIGQYSAGLILPGDTPKTNRFSEVVLLGSAIVEVRREMLETPAVTQENAILLRDWQDIETLHERLPDWQQVSAQADVAYKSGWSPRGQAALLVERINGK